jgi:hypothetical protein
VAGNVGSGAESRLARLPELVLALGVVQEADPVAVELQVVEHPPGMVVSLLDGVGAELGKEPSVAVGELSDCVGVLVLDLLVADQPAVHALERDRTVLGHGRDGIARLGHAQKSRGRRGCAA